MLECCQTASDLEPLSCPIGDRIFDHLSLLRQINGRTWDSADVKRYIPIFWARFPKGSNIIDTGTTCLVVVVSEHSSLGSQRSLLKS